MLSGGRSSPFRLPRWRVGCTTRFDANTKSRKTPATRQPAKNKRWRRGKNPRKRTTRDCRRSSIRMPPGTSHLERGGGEFLQCFHPDRKSTRLNSSHTVISYAVFCLKKKKKHKREILTK